MNFGHHSLEESEFRARPEEFVVEEPQLYFFSVPTYYYSILESPNTSESSCDTASTQFEEEDVPQEQEIVQNSVDSEFNFSMEVRNRTDSNSSNSSIDVNGFDWSFVPDSSRRDKIKKWKSKKPLMQTGQTHIKTYCNRQKSALDRPRLNGKFAPRTDFLSQNPSSPMEYDFSIRGHSL
jgi:hypothetical protein